MRRWIVTDGDARSANASVRRDAIHLRVTGSRNPTYLVLWDMGLVIEFPPGATILIPSATLRHSNVCLNPGDTRMSFTQYSAGGLFRWVDQGF